MRIIGGGWPKMPHSPTLPTVTSQSGTVHISCGATGRERILTLCGMHLRGDCSQDSAADPENLSCQFCICAMAYGDTVRQALGRLPPLGSVVNPDANTVDAICEATGLTPERVTNTVIGREDLMWSATDRSQVCLTNHAPRVMAGA